MRTIICGGRHYNLTVHDFAWLDELRTTLPITSIISGGATGADYGGEKFARMNKIPLTVKPADWKRWGKLAGFFRNAEMAEIADAVIAFPGGTGTADMVRRAKEKGLRMTIKNPAHF